jgi:uncharacterized protein YjbI with pentapeptide repeats
MSVTAQEPPKLRLTDIRVDLKKLFLKLGEAATRAGLGTATGDWKGVAGGIITAAFGAAEAVSVEKPPEVLAWELIRNGLTGALGELIMENLANQRPPHSGDQQYLDTRIDLAIGEDAVSIDPSFFQNPAALPLVHRVEGLFAGWLDRYLDVPKPTAIALARRLQSYFSVALHEEWKAHQGHYEKLLSALTGPFAAAARWEREWHRYHLLLVKQFDRPVFEEPFALSAVYVPLRAVWEEVVRSSGAERATQRSGFAKTAERLPTRSVVVDLETSIRSWLSKATREDAIRLIRGGPGSGKSTFARKLAADIASNADTRVLYFALQHFRMSGKLIDAIGEALGPNGAEAFAGNPLSQPHFASRERPVLMIFDGLDELAQPGRDAHDQTNSFLHELRLHLDRWNEQNCRVFALLTGRSAAVQANRSELRPSEGQELEVLPFLVTEQSIEKRREEGRPFLDEGGKLSDDGRKVWWQKYKACKAGEPDEMPEALDRQEVRDLSAEPLLLYLLVRSGYHRHRLDDQPFNRNELYATLFQDVANRRYAGGRAPAAFHELGDKFEPVMETIATAAWYGDGRTATVEDIRHWCPAHLKGNLERFLSNPAGTTRLIAAFYFQQVVEATRRRDAIEFTHKSFGEYLTARRLVRAVSEIHEELSRNSPRYTEFQALLEWFELTHQTRMDVDLLRFVRDEILLRHSEAGDWQVSLCRLLNYDLRHGMPVRLSDDVTFRAGERQARNAEETLLAALNACARATGERTTPAWPDSVSAGELILRLRGQRADFSSILGLACLGLADFSGQRLVFQDLFGADLRGANLEGVDLQDAVLVVANLQGVNLQHANLEDASLDGANLEDASLEGTILRDAGLDSANLTRTNLQGANLRGASLRGAKLRDANLENASLANANLRGANPKGTNLNGADLRGARGSALPERAPWLG